MRTLTRLIKVAAKRTVRNPYNAFAAIFVMFLSFFIAGAFVVISYGSTILLAYFESQPQVTAFLKDDTSSESVLGIQDKLNSTGLVAKSKYISKEEALKIYQDRNKEEPLLNEFVTADILPASIEVSTYKLTDLDQIAQVLGQDGSVEEVVFQKDIVDTLATWSMGIRTIGGGVVIFLLLTSFLITLIVVGLNISLHKEEIEIMKLVGATSGYIRTPFLFEGVFYGVASALLATGILWGIFAWASPVLQETFRGIPILTPTAVVFGYLLLGEVIIGSLIGVVGSVVATRKYLAV